MAELIDQVKGVKSTFSSWDSCMSKTYCKWPVIAAIIIGTLIVLSVLWCVFSCLCCGLSLCTACGRCMTCRCCAGGGGGKRRKDPEYQPMPATPTPYTGYQAPPPMFHNTGPQFATFDAGNKRSANVHEDSLPAMPSWNNAATRRVEDTSPQQSGVDMEMERMLPQSQSHAAMSPVHSPSPVQSQRYASDIGVQRMNHQQSYDDGYRDAPAQPLSPAPTYRSSIPNLPPNPQNSYHHDSYSNSPTQYHSNYDNPPVNTGVAPYPSSRESVQFTPSRIMSPSAVPAYTSYQPASHEQYQQQQTNHEQYQHINHAYQSPNQTQYQDTRPPSLLQVGRKPVNYREV